jgi:hypothetical protein
MTNAYCIHLLINLGALMTVGFHLVSQQYDLDSLLARANTQGKTSGTGRLGFELK